jgi:transcriptional regulator with XRE-family HTH domain
MYLSVNLRYLLWRDRVPRSRWVEQLAAWAGCDRRRAETLIDGARATPDEQARIVNAVGVSEEELCFTELVEQSGVNIFSENLRYLMDGLDRGGHRQLAKRLDVHVSTLSKWRSGRQRPRKRQMDALYRFFGLSAVADLLTEPLFLSFVPVSALQRRAWLKARIDTLPPTTLAQLFPALQRLVSEP